MLPSGYARSCRHSAPRATFSFRPLLPSSFQSLHSSNKRYKMCNIFRKSNGYTGFSSQQKIVLKKVTKISTLFLHLGHKHVHQLCKHALLRYTDPTRQREQVAGRSKLALRVGGDGAGFGTRRPTRTHDSWRNLTCLGPDDTGLHSPTSYRVGHRLGRPLPCVSW